MTPPIAGAQLPTEGVRSFGFARSATHTHQGVDLPAPEGTDVLAAAPGVVRHATDAWQQGFSGYGRVVVVEHPDLGAWTLYAHLSQALVAPGEVVKEGERIGLVGRTAFTHADHEAEFSSSGAHLHFEVSPRPYPQGSEEARIPPVAWLQSLDPLYEAADPFVQAPMGAKLQSALSGLSSSPQSVQPHSQSSDVAPKHCASPECRASLCGCTCSACVAALEAETAPGAP